MDTHISFLVQINHDFFHMWNFKMHFFPMLISLIILKNVFNSLSVSVSSVEMIHPQVWHIWLNSMISAQVCFGLSEMCSFITELNLTVPRAVHTDKRPCVANCSQKKTQLRHVFQILCILVLRMLLTQEWIDGSIYPTCLVTFGVGPNKNYLSYLQKETHAQSDSGGWWHK